MTQPSQNSNLRTAAISFSVLIGWMMLAGALRLHHLTLKPIWTDEFSTLVFGLGHSFNPIPLDHIIDASTLLAPVQPTSDTTLLDAAQRVLTESNHPPLYFMLTHGWLHLFPTQNGYISLWAARSLSTLFGILAVPAMYVMGWTAFRSRAIAHCAAALMAVSPFGIYLAQDARHYTLAVLWMIVSMTYLFKAIQQYIDRKPLSAPVIWGWIVTNGLGIASHYFFVMTLATEAIAFIIIIIWDRWTAQGWYRAGIRHLVLVSLGTATSVLVWAPFLFSIRQGDALTRWLDVEGWQNWAWVNPLLHTVGSLISMVMLFPVQNVDDTVVTASAIGLALFTGLFGWRCYQGICTRRIAHSHQIAIRALLTFAGVAIALMLFTTYALGIELAQVFRYHFFYYPSILLLVAVGLCLAPNASATPNSTFQIERNSPLQRSRVQMGLIGGLIVLGILGSLTVTQDLGYRKLHRPDRIVKEINKRSDHPVLVAISHQTHGQTGRLMALAWEMRSPQYHHLLPDASFLLDHQSCNEDDRLECHQPTTNLRSVIREQAQPLDLWLINYEGQANMRAEGCKHQRTKRTDGYKAQHYTCHL